MLRVLFLSILTITITILLFILAFLMLKKRVKREYIPFVFLLNGIGFLINILQVLIVPNNIAYYTEAFVILCVSWGIIFNLLFLINKAKWVEGVQKPRNRKRDLLIFVFFTIILSIGIFYPGSIYIKPFPNTAFFSLEFVLFFAFVIGILAVISLKISLDIYKYIESEYRYRFTLYVIGMLGFHCGIIGGATFNWIETTSMRTLWIFISLPLGITAFLLIYYGVIKQIESK